MLIGVPKEIKAQEHRVGLVPASVREFTSHGHKVMVEAGAGAGINFTDSDYEAHGAEIVKTAAEIFQRADMIIKVKEPQSQECKMLREGQILFTYGGGRPVRGGCRPRAAPARYFSSISISPQIRNKPKR